MTYTELVDELQDGPRGDASPPEGNECVPVRVSIEDGGLELNHVQLRVQRTDGDCND